MTVVLLEGNENVAREAGEEWQSRNIDAGV